MSGDKPEEKEKQAGDKQRTQRWLTKPLTDWFRMMWVLWKKGKSKCTWSRRTWKSRRRRTREVFKFGLLDKRVKVCFGRLTSVCLCVCLCLDRQTYIDVSFYYCVSIWVSVCLFLQTSRAAVPAETHLQLSNSPTQSLKVRQPEMFEHKSRGQRSRPAFKSTAKEDKHLMSHGFFSEWMMPHAHASTRAWTHTHTHTNESLDWLRIHVASCFLGRNAEKV